MTTDVQWIVDALQKDPSKTRAGIARALNVDKSAITRLLAGERRLKFSEAHIIGDYLGVSVPHRPLGGLAEDQAEFVTASTEAARAPIMAASPLFKGKWLLHRDRKPVDFRLRPPNVAMTEGVFGFYAPDRAMAPRFRPGETIWIDPTRPPIVGGDILLADKKTDPDAQVIFVGELTDEKPDRWMVRQSDSGRATAFPKDAWTAFRILPRY